MWTAVVDRVHRSTVNHRERGAMTGSISAAWPRSNGQQNLITGASQWRDAAARRVHARVCPWRRAHWAWLTGDSGPPDPQQGNARIGLDATVPLVRFPWPHLGLEGVHDDNGGSAAVEGERRVWPDQTEGKKRKRERARDAPQPCECEGATRQHRHDGGAKLGESVMAVASFQRERVRMEGGNSLEVGTGE